MENSAPGLTERLSQSFQGVATQRQACEHAKAASLFKAILERCNANLGDQLHRDFENNPGWHCYGLRGAQSREGLFIVMAPPSEEPAGRLLSIVYVNNAQTILNASSQRRQWYGGEDRVAFAAGGLQTLIDLQTALNTGIAESGPVFQAIDDRTANRILRTPLREP